MKYSASTWEGEPPKTVYLVKRECKTTVASCVKEDNGSKCLIYYEGSSTPYIYNASNVLPLYRRQVYELSHYRLFCQGCEVRDAVYLARYESRHKTTYWLVAKRNEEGPFQGTPKERLKGTLYEATEVALMPYCSSDNAITNLLAYLQEVAAGNPLTGDDNESLLSKQYQSLPQTPTTSVLATYLNPKAFPLTRCQAPPLIFPFGSNASQLRAVRAAFESSISLIQGPPGTGKTQTILNILANLLVQGRSALVVSSNTVAVANVMEKLEQYDLGFCAALLGRRENHTAFFESQQEKKGYPEAMASWAGNGKHRPVTLQEIIDQVTRLETIYRYQEQLAADREELHALETEQKHYLQEKGYSAQTVAPRVWCNSRTLMRLVAGWEELARAELSDRPLPSWRLRWRRGLLQLACRQALTGRKELNRLFRQPEKLVAQLRTLWYTVRGHELQQEITLLEKKLLGKQDTEQTQQLTERSLEYLQHTLYQKYGHRDQKKLITSADLTRNPKKVLDEYPIILSTTFSSRNNLPGTLFDYVIVDESSQVSIDTGVLALSCGRHAVIVGDEKQLPNVLSETQAETLRGIGALHRVPEAYDCSRHSLLTSMAQALPNAPCTLLREHYRCHPKIIGFCNQRFYGGRLLCMTQDNGEPDVLSAILTAPGKHSSTCQSEQTGQRSRCNQREVDEIMARFGSSWNDKTAVITPFRGQVDVLRAQKLPESCLFESNTVHQFQGHEMDTIILSMVEDRITPFVDNPQLLNVAISRAKKRLCVVMTGNPLPEGSILGDLLKYIRYQEGTVTRSQLSSIFDFLHKEYSNSLNAKSSTEHYPPMLTLPSEQQAYDAIRHILQSSPAFDGLDLLIHYPLSQLLGTDTLLRTERERAYAYHPWTHVDFLIYNRAGKEAVLAVEVDGVTYHSPGSRQWERDRLKDEILTRYGVAFERLSTQGVDECARIEAHLRNVMGLPVPA